MTIQITKDTVLVSGSAFIKHDYYFYRIPQLIEALYRIKHELADKKLKIVFPDGEPIKQTGIETVLATIASEFDLPPSRLIVATVNKEFSSPWATVEYFPSPFFNRCINELKYFAQPDLNNNFALFGISARRWSIERFLLSAFLANKHSDKSFVIFHPKADLVNFEFQGLEESFPQELDWHRNYHLPLENDSKNFIIESQGGTKKDLGLYENLWPNYLIEIVAETDCHCKYWITEKTLRCLFTGKPFIALAGAGLMSWLRELGFKTFDPIIDESYDQESRSTERVTLIKKEIDRIAGLTSQELQTLTQQLQPILEYNQQNFARIAEQYYKNFSIQSS